MKEAREKAKPGATGRFPEGKLNPAYEGEIQFEVGNIRDKVFVDFGKEVAWIGMDADQAEELAKIIRKKAKKARRFAGMT